MKHLKKLNFEIIISLGLIASIVLLLNPFQTLMSEMLLMCLQGLVVIFGFILVGMVWKETAHDEREKFHRMASSRMAFIAGELSIIVAIIVQTLQHNLDGYLIFILGIMVVTKLLSRVFIERKF